MASKRKTRPSSSTSAAAATAAANGASSSKKARIVEPSAEDFSDFEKEEASTSSGIPAGEQEEERNSVAVRANGGRRNVQQRRSRERGSGSNPESSSTAQSENLKSNKADDDDDDGPFARLFGDPVPDEEARTRWPHRYLKKAEKQRVGSRTLVDTDDSEEKIPARRHYLQAEVDGHTLYNLYDDGHVQAADGEESYICRIVEIFEADDGTPYFTAQWYYRATDTVIKKAVTVDNKRVFFSEIQNDNPLECLVGKLKIVRISLNLDLEEKMSAIHGADYYCDTLYLLPYSTFANLPPEKVKAESDSSSTISTDDDGNMVSSDYNEVCRMSKHPRSEATLLDLYSGCGAMSTGLCLGAKKSGLNLVTRWAVDLNKYACESLKLNHPETEVRNESAEDFLSLLKEWEKLCVRFSLISGSNERQHPYPFDVNDGDGDTQEDEGDNEDDNEDDSEVFEVDRIIQICYGDPNKSKEPGLYFKVSWKKYGPDYDTWEPIEGLSNCRDAIQEFVVNGYKSRILPLPGHVDVICGGPPCQGVSGFNRFRNRREPLEDEKNKQLVVFMDIVNYLRPKFVLMENVVDILKFADGFLGRYALGRLVDMNYQSRLGMMAAGAYGLPQFRMRAFLWGAHPTKRLPQYPLPTHDVVVRGVVPLQFESNVVAYDAGSDAQLEKKLLLKDAISDLPAVENNEDRDEMPYDKNSETEFQEQIRLRNGLLGSKKDLLYDHRPLKLNEDDFDRVCQIPKKKGANFRDLPGVIVGPDNKVEWDPNVERVLLKSGKPLVPDYAMSFVNGTSSKPFARLWWDETVPTVVTRAEPHNQAILHPEQDRVLSIRENARLQGFPDCYKLCGPIKERYIQVGNAVAVPVARALGYALGMAFQGLAEDQPLFTLPKKFPNVLEKCSAGSSDEDA